MSRKVLVLSVHEAFRSLLQNSLKGNGGFQVTLTTETGDATRILDQHRFDLLLVDLDDNLSALQAVRQILQAHPQMKLIVFAPPNELRHPLLTELRPSACLTKPFYLPDLLAALEGALAGIIPPVPAENEQLPDPARLARIFAGWLEPTRALGGIVLRQGEPPFLAGVLGEEDLREAALILARSWQSERRSDLIRYFRLQNSRQDVLLYATPLMETSQLGVLFEAHTSLKDARRATQQLSRLWRETPELQAQPAPQPVDFLTFPPVVESEPGLGDALPLLEEANGVDEAEQIKLDDLLGNLPLPDAQIVTPAAGSEWRREEEFNLTSEEDVMLPWEQNILPDEPAEKDTLPEPAAVADVDVEETRPSRRSEGPPPGGEVSLAEKRQTYTCILLPRLPHISLDGELSAELQGWMPEFCATLGYLLESLRIEPQYLLWSVSLPPTVSPGYLVRILRNQSSARLYERFPQAEWAAAGGDFWASAHLIMRSRQHPESHLIQDFIQRARRRQAFLSS